MRGRRRWAGLVLVVLPFLGFAVGGCLPPAPPRPAAPQGDYLFCFWNLENFFDDQVDHRPSKVDQVYDRWFGENPEVFKQKLANVSKVLAALNDGRGPDILAVAEVEDRRAAELLRDALNARLPQGAPPYQHVLMEEVSGGRHIATAILTRLPAEAGRTRLLGRRQRILEGHLVVNGQELVVVASHWTSRVSSKEDREGSGRDKYAEVIYGRFKAMYLRDPRVAFLVCGDFNDTPHDQSVREALHAGGSREEVRRAAARGEPVLFDLFTDLDPAQYGTHSYRGKWFIFDQIVVSPGLLGDRGWVCLTDTVHTVRDRTADRKGRPRDFGSPSDRLPLSERGYSDHFPVTVRLALHGP
ncbi:MAG TPA: endonuclease/exonuclease/phosphatase family protein [Gemmataceae bacterium]|nr:endonuclease/exonuclease/phosphatase family protein [Gemmataceae bacterium]